MIGDRYIDAPMLKLFVELVDARRQDVGQSAQQVDFLVRGGRGRRCDAHHQHKCQSGSRRTECRAETREHRWSSTYDTTRSGPPSQFKPVALSVIAERTPRPTV